MENKVIQHVTKSYCVYCVYRIVIMSMSVLFHLRKKSLSLSHVYRSKIDVICYNLYIALLISYCFFFSHFFLLNVQTGAIIGGEHLSRI